MKDAMRFAVFLFGLLLVLTVGASAWLALQSCGLRLPFATAALDWCEAPPDRTVLRQLARAEAQTQALRARIAAQEKALALKQCQAVAPEPPPPPPPPPKPAAPPPTPSGLDPEAFDKGDISVMEGCWLLSSDYAARDIDTGAITRFNYWRICFDGKGRGTEEMRATNGTSCKGRISGRIPGNGRLTMREPGNLRCDNGMYVFRRDITCSLDARGLAQCDTYQPETDGRGSATLRRARR